MTSNPREPRFFATEGENGIQELHLGPMKVTWSSFGDRVCLHVEAGGNRMDVYSSATGRSLRVFKGGEEMH